MCISASRARALAAAALLAAVTSLFSVTATSQAATTTVGLSPALAGLAGQLQTSLLSDMDGSSPSDGNFYSDGAWYAPDGPACWFCYDTAADGAATLSQIDDNPALAQVAIDTFTTAIADHQLPSGEFTDDSGDASQVDTGFIAVDLGVAYLELYSDLSSTTRSAWSTALGNAASYLINSGATTWYINGNVNLRQTEVMWLAWTATQNPTFLTAYNSEWTFTISPSQTRWPGYGLQITQPTTNSDGVGGSGYLAESNTGTDPGFDPNYTQAQLDTATDLYVLTRDPRYLWLMNLEYDQLQPLVSSSWVLNATGGTRDSFIEPFNTPALAVLAASGTRPDLVADVGPQLAATEADYQQTYNLANVNYYKGFESLAMPLLEVQWPQGMSAATSLSTTPTAVVATPTTTSTTPTTTSTTPTAPTPTTGTTPTTTTPKPTTTTPSPAAAPTTPKSTPAPSASPPKTGTPTATKKITATVATAGTTVRSTHLNVTRLRRVKKKAKRSHGRHKPKHVRRV